MPQKRQYRIFFAHFPYGGNGAAPSEHPSIRAWFSSAMLMLRDHPLVYDVKSQDFADTPVTMTRNAAVLAARKAQADILVMIDSDQVPDIYLDPKYAGTELQARAKPFLPVAIDVIDGHYEKGPVVVCAPYCGPPPEEAPYLFLWDSCQDQGAEPVMRIRMMTRNEAAQMTGMVRVAAQPTGLIAFDMRAFEYTEPKTNDDKPWFYYEWSDRYASEKASTEDVTATRDISLAIMAKLGYNPLLCASECWAGHVKPYVVGKPMPLPDIAVGGKFKAAVLSGFRTDEGVADVGAPQSRV